MTTRKIRKHTHRWVFDSYSQDGYSHYAYYHCKTCPKAVKNEVKEYDN